LPISKSDVAGCLLPSIKLKESNQLTNLTRPSSIPARYLLVAYHDEAVVKVASVSFYYTDVTRCYLDVLGGSAAYGYGMANGGRAKGEHRSLITASESLGISLDIPLNPKEGAFELSRQVLKRIAEINGYEVFAVMK